MTSNDKKYTTSVTVTGGRRGHAVSDDGVLDVQLRAPKTNGTSDGTNPEQLFAAAWAACFGSALEHIAKGKGVDPTDSSVRVEVYQGADYKLGANIFVSIPGADTATTQELAEAAHAICPYSNATRGNMDVEVSAI